MSVCETARILPDFQGHSEMRLVSHDLSSSSDRLRNLFPTSRDQLPSSLSTILTHREASREETDGRRREKTNKQKPKTNKTKQGVGQLAGRAPSPAGGLAPRPPFLTGSRGGRELRCFLLPLPVLLPPLPPSLPRFFSSGSSRALRHPQDASLPTVLLIIASAGAGGRKYQKAAAVQLPAISTPAGRHPASSACPPRPPLRRLFVPSPPTHEAEPRAGS